MSHDSIQASGCSEYRALSRRSFLKSSAAAALIASSPSWLPRVAYADSGGSDRDIVVSIYLRGGADGLTLCAPHGDDDYYVHRPQLAIPPPDSSDPNRLTDLDGFFGLPPAMAPLLPVYQAGHLAFVHACGLTSTTRSHFDAQRFMEVGQVGSGASDGWLGRHLATVSPLDGTSVLRGVTFDTAMALTMIGAPLSLPINDPESFGILGTSATRDDRAGRISQMYDHDDVLNVVADNTMATIALLETIDFAGYTPAGGASYPPSQFGDALRATAALIRANVGVEAVHVNKNGWDTHASQGVVTGTMAGLMDDLALGLLALHADMEASGHLGRLIVVVLTEFGRVVAENGSLGTDHGHGGAMIVMGGGVVGGQVMRTWPGLATEQLFAQRDLAITLDYRDILAEIVDKRLGNPNVGSVFPNYTATYRGIVV